MALASLRPGRPPVRPPLATDSGESRSNRGGAHTAASGSGSDVRPLTADGAFLGALTGGWLDVAHPAGGMWVFALSLVGAAMGATTSRPTPAARRKPNQVYIGHHGEDHGPSMAAMACATAGGLAGALLASALHYVALGPHAGHGAHLPGPSASSMACSFSAQWSALDMYLMNGAMGGMIGSNLPDCPFLEPARQFLRRLLRSRG